MVNSSDPQDEEEELVSRFWDELAAMLFEAESFAALWAADRYEVLRAWAALEEDSGHTVIDTYAAAIHDPEAGADYGPGLAELLRHRDLDDEAEALLACRLEHARRGADDQALANALGEFAQASRGPRKRAANEERLDLCRRIGDLHGLQDALLEKAWWRWVDGLASDDPDGEGDARRLLQEQRRICRDQGDLRGLANWATAKAWMLYCEGYPAPMPRLLAMQERLCRASGDLESLCCCLLDEARILRREPSSRQCAWAQMDEAEVLAREIGLQALVDAALRDKGVCALLEGDEARAEQLLLAARLEPAAGDAESSLEVALRHALDFPDMEDGRMAEACLGAEFLGIAERVARRLGDSGAIQWVLGCRAEALEETDPGTALVLCTERETLCRDLGRVRGLADTLKMKAGLLLGAGRATEAFAVLREQGDVCRREGLSWRLRGIQVAQARALRMALKHCGDLDASVSLQERLALVCLELGDRVGVRAAMRARSRALRTLGRSQLRALPVDPRQLRFDL